MDCSWMRSHGLQMGAWSRRDTFWCIAPKSCYASHRPPQPRGSIAFSAIRARIGLCQTPHHDTAYIYIAGLARIEGVEDR